MLPQTVSTSSLGLRTLPTTSTSANFDFNRLPVSGPHPPALFGGGPAPGLPSGPLRPGFPSGGAPFASIGPTQSPNPVPPPPAPHINFFGPAAASFAYQMGILPPGPFFRQFQPFTPDFRNHFFREDPKPNYSYIGLIAMAILSTKEQKMVLSDIYQWIQDNYPYFRTRGPGWRNSIRHNLSLNDCFIKVGRSSNGKGHYWGIHPANQDDFKKGDFRRRRAQRKVRRALGLSCPDDDDTPSPSPTEKKAFDWTTAAAAAAASSVLLSPPVGHQLPDLVDTPHDDAAGNLDDICLLKDDSDPAGNEAVEMVKREFQDSSLPQDEEKDEEENSPVRLSTTNDLDSTREESATDLVSRQRRRGAFDMASLLTPDSGRSGSGQAKDAAQLPPTLNWNVIGFAAAAFNNGSPGCLPCPPQHFPYFPFFGKTGGPSTIPGPSSKQVQQYFQQSLFNLPHHHQTYHNAVTKPVLPTEKEFTGH